MVRVEVSHFIAPRAPISTGTWFDEQVRYHCGDGLIGAIRPNSARRCSLKTSFNFCSSTLNAGCCGMIASHCWFRISQEIGATHVEPPKYLLHVLGGIHWVNYYGAHSAVELTPAPSTTGCVFYNLRDFSWRCFHCSPYGQGAHSRRAIGRLVAEHGGAKISELDAWTATIVPMSGDMRLPMRIS